MAGSLSEHVLSGQSPGQSLPAVFYAGFLKFAQVQPLQESVDSLIRTIKIIVFQKLPDILTCPCDLGEYFTRWIRGSVGSVGSVNCEKVDWWIGKGRSGGWERQMWIRGSRWIRIR